MASAREIHPITALLLATGLALAGDIAWAQGADAEAGELRSARIHLDNDLFAASDRDRDYTGGFAVTISGVAAREGLFSLDPLLAQIDARVGGALYGEVQYARQVGLIAFTPGDVLTREALPQDRPYASMVFLANGRMYVDEDGRGAWSSTVNLGVLGSSLAGRLHNVVHDAIGSARPRGYSHQISAGGEPTARYALARHHLLIADPSGALDVKATLQGSIGYLTEASAAISMRVGRFATQWWSWAPELTDYMAAPIPVETARETRNSGGELYFFAGARLKARAYNAFLQGQFRDSDVRVSHAQMETLTAHAWLGVVTQIFEQTQLSYTLNYQTAELRKGAGARSSLWGGVQLAQAF